MTPKQMRRLADKLSVIGHKLDDDASRLIKAGHRTAAVRLWDARSALLRAWSEIDDLATEQGA